MGLYNLVNAPPLVGRLDFIILNVFKQLDHFLLIKMLVYLSEIVELFVLYRDLSKADVLLEKAFQDCEVLLGILEIVHELVGIGEGNSVFSTELDQCLVLVLLFIVVLQLY